MLTRAARPVARLGATEARRAFAGHSAPEDHPIHAHLKSVPQSPTLAISELSARLKAQGKTVHRFGLGQSPFPVFPPMIDLVSPFYGELWPRCTRC